MRTRRLLASLVSLTLFGAVAAGCGEPGPDDSPAPVPTTPDAPGGGGKADSSALATFLTFEFDAYVETDSAGFFGGDRQLIQDQLLYTIGHLNFNKSVGRLDNLELEIGQAERTPEGKRRVPYKARLPVAWGSKTNVPTSYEMRLPRDMSYSGQRAFTEKYKQSCVDWGAHDVDEGSMWYYYRPQVSGCTIDEADVVRFTATATPSSLETTGKYPEYHKVWEDGELRVVAIFGKYEDGATTASDAGISAFNTFVATTKRELAPYGVKTIPESVPSSPGIAVPDITFSATLADGRKVEIVALLVDNVRTGSPDYDFNARYNALSTRADLIAYNGHAGLGQNVRALARNGTWTAGQYLMLFMNGCDTYAYVDGSLAEARARVNPDDPTGTKYMDIITNAMPSFFSSTPYASMALIKGLLSYANPQTYEQIFRNIDSSQVVLVTGEQDNVYTPEMDGGGSGAKLEESGTVDRNQSISYRTEELPAGQYIVTLSGDNDADLYVRVNADPTTTSYDCRPFLAGSDEECKVSLTEPGVIHVMVRGWAASSSFSVKVE